MEWMKLMINVLCSYGVDETLMINVLCGILSGVISSSIANPTDVLKVIHTYMLHS